MQCAANITSSEGKIELVETEMIVSKTEALTALEVICQFFVKSEGHIQTENRL